MTLLALPVYKQRIMALLLVLGLAGGVLTIDTVTGTPAHAATYTVAYTGGDGVAVRSQPTAASKIPGTVLRDGTGLTVICQQFTSDGSAVGPRANRVMNKIALAPLPGGTGWVPDAYVSGTAASNTFTPSIARCPAGAPTDAAAEKAIAYASKYLGTGSYNGWCLQFMYDSYLAGGKNIGSSYSADSYARANQARLRTDGIPPRGALVFWYRDSYNPYGHVVLSTGSGMAITSAERSWSIVRTMKIADRTAAPKPYAGWLMP